MNRGHDLGGKQGFGLIGQEPEATEPRFHAGWEKRVFALTLATGMLGKWNLDESRHARERQQAEKYLSNSYYENWLAGLEKLLVEKCLISQAELDSGIVDNSAEKTEGLRVPSTQDAKNILARGGPTLVDSQQAPKFHKGDKVRVRYSPCSGHTRAPAYVHDAIGIIHDHHGCHIFPDSHAAGNKTGAHLYSVVFADSALWNQAADNSEVAVDLWEPYLQTVVETEHA